MNVNITLVALCQGDSDQYFNLLSTLEKIPY